jgi:hypothetical protein
LVKKEQVEAFGAIGFPVDTSTRRTIPVEIILEGSDFFFVMAAGLPEEQAVKGVRFSKESFDAVYYVSEKSARVPGL